MRHKNASLQDAVLAQPQPAGHCSRAAGRPRASQMLQGLLLPESFLPKDQVTSSQVIQSIQSTLISDKCYSIYQLVYEMCMSFNVLF